MAEIQFYNNEEDIIAIKEVKKGFVGNVILTGEKHQAQIDFDSISQKYKLKIRFCIDLDKDEDFFVFSTEDLELKIEAIITSNKNNINVFENWSQYYSEGNIYSIQSKEFSAKEEAFYRSYYKIETVNFLKDFRSSVYKTNLFSSTGLLKLKINSDEIFLYPYHSDYLIIESKSKINYEKFTSVAYNTLVALGFISGKFIQNEVYTFQYKDSSKKNRIGYEYKKLREESNSIYHAIVTNPFSYRFLIGDIYADNLYKENTLKKIDTSSFSYLIQLINNNTQIQYALVLFNEVNDNRLSLLVKNNGFYVVLEVFKKFFYDIFKTEINKDYSQKGNVDKYRIVFEKIISLNENDISVLKDRNKYLHGDIKELEGTEMIETMQKQLSLIYKILLKYIRMEVFVIDHYCLRNKKAEGFFISLNNKR